MTEIEKMIADYNLDPENSAIRKYYDENNIWRTLGVERDENCHSKFLAWVLGLNFNKAHSPLYRFIYLLIRNADRQQKVSVQKELEQAIVCDTLELKKVHITTEQTVSSLSTIRYNDRIDIYANCEIAGVDGDFNCLEIFIENKVASKEGKKKIKATFNESQDEIKYSQINQTERYYFACAKENSRRKSPPFDKNKTIQIFVFLTPSYDEPSEKHYVKISYQNLVDYVLEPLLRPSGIDDYTTATIREYMRALCNPNNKYNLILATMEEEKKLMKNFLDRNMDLFLKAFEVLKNSDEITEEQQEQIVEMENLSKKFKTVGKRRTYRINGEGSYKMYEVVAEFVKYRLKQGAEFGKIEEYIKDKTKQKTIIHISLEKDKVQRSQVHYHIAECDNSTFYVTKEWGGATKEEYSDKKGKDANFVLLYKAINKDYGKEFCVEEIQA